MCRKGKFDGFLFYLAHWVSSLLDICTFMCWDQTNLVSYQFDGRERTNIYDFQRTVSLNPASCCMRHELGHLNVFMSLTMMVLPVLPSTAPGNKEMWEQHQADVHFSAEA